MEIMIDHATDYSGFKKIYFLKIIFKIRKIIKIHNFKNILDYGCGKKILSSKIQFRGVKIYNYDINPKYTDIKNFDNLIFDCVVINHVLMYLTCTNIEKLILKFKKINNRTKFIIDIGKQNFLSRLLMFITNNFNAHHGTLSTYLQQKAIIQKYFKIINQFNIYGLTTVFFLEFK